MAGRIIQINIDRPKEEKQAPGTGGGLREAAEGCTLFVHGISQETDNASLQAAFEGYGTLLMLTIPEKDLPLLPFLRLERLRLLWKLFRADYWIMIEN